MNKTLGIAAVAAAGVALGGWLWLGGDSPATTAGSTQFAAPGAAQAQSSGAEAVDTSRVLEMVVGAEDAPVTIIEYVSFTCPHCANFANSVYPQIHQNYIDTGVVRFITREVYFDAYGLWAGMVARCGGPERYHGIVEMLYATQSDWVRARPAAGQSEGEAVADELRRIGRRAGMNDEEINACLSDRDMAMAMMEVYRQNAEADSVRATPSFFINGRPYSNMSYADFESAIAAAQN